MNKYEIIKGDSRIELEDKVNRAIEVCDMVPIGGVVIVYEQNTPQSATSQSYVIWAQAMVRKNVYEKIK